MPGGRADGEQLGDEDPGEDVLGVVTEVLVGPDGRTHARNALGEFVSLLAGANREPCRHGSHHQEDRSHGPEVARPLQDQTQQVDGKAQDEGHDDEVDDLGVIGADGRHDRSGWMGRENRCELKVFRWTRHRRPTDTLPARALPELEDLRHVMPPVPAIQLQQQVHVDVTDLGVCQPSREVVGLQDIQEA